MSDERVLPVENNPDPLTTELVKINITDAVLTKLRAEAEAFKDPTTKEEYEAIRRHRLDMVPLRTMTAKVLKAMREDAVAFQKKVITKENEITGNIAESEAIDAKKEKVWLDAQAAIQAEKDRIEAERVKVLFDQLKAYDWPGNEMICSQYTPEEFAAELSKVKANWEAVQAAKKADADRLAREAQERAEQEERNRAEAERLRKIEQDQREAQARIDAERAKIEEDKAKALKEIEDAKLKAQVEENARVAEANRKEQERLYIERKKLEDAEREEERKKYEAEKAARLAALAPDKDKIGHYAEMIEASLSAHAISIEDVELRGKFLMLVDDLQSTLDRIKELA